MMSLFAHFWNLVHRTRVIGEEPSLSRSRIPEPAWNDSRRSADFGVPSPINRTSAGATLSSPISASFLQHCWDSMLKTPEPSARDARSVSAHLHTKGQSRCSTGGMMAAMAKAGRDKVTLLASPTLQSFGLWVEQLLRKAPAKKGRDSYP